MPTLSWHDDGRQLALRIDYERRELAKRIPDYRWDAASKCWLYPGNVFTVHDAWQLIPDLQVDPAVLADLRLENDILKAGGLTAAARSGLLDEHRPAALGYEPRRAMKPHQAQSFAVLDYRDNVLLGSDMGTGKTQIAIDACCHALRAGRIARVLVLCPPSLRRTWQREIARVATVGADDVSVVRGNPPAATGERARGLTDKEYRLLVIGKQATWTVAHYQCAHLHQGELGELVAGNALVLDEATSPSGVKSPESKTREAVASWSPSKLLVLTGTPLSNTPLDVWSLADLVEPGLLGSTVHRFRDRYCVVEEGVRHVRQVADDGTSSVDERKYKQIVDYKDTDEMHRRLSTIMVRHRKEEELDLPPLVEEDRFVELSSEIDPNLRTSQRAAYEGLRDALMLEWQDRDGEWFSINAANVLTELLRLQQIADGFLSAEAGTWRAFASNPKVEALRDVAETALADPAKKIVVWGRFLPTLDIAGRVMGSLGLEPVLYSGRYGHEVRQQHVDRFLEDPDCRAFVGQINAAGFGLNLQETAQGAPIDLCVFYDLWWAPSTNRQAADRLHRIGQRSTVNVVRLLTENTVEDRIIELLEKKGRWADQIVDGRQVEAGQVVFTRDETLALLAP